MLIEYLEDNKVNFRFITQPDVKWWGLLDFLYSGVVNVKHITYPMHTISVTFKSKKDVMIIKLMYGDKTPHG